MAEAVLDAMTPDEAWLEGLETGFHGQPSARYDEARFEHPTEYDRGFEAGVEMRAHRKVFVVVKSRERRGMLEAMR